VALKLFPHPISRPPQCCGQDMTRTASGWQCTAPTHGTKA